VKINRDKTVRIQMTCPACGKTLSAPDTAAGKKAKCPSCREIILVPEAVQESQGFYPSAPQPSAPSAPPAPPAPPPPSGSPDKWLDQLQGPSPVPTASGGERRRHHGKSYQGFAVTSMIFGIVSIVGMLGCCVPFVGVIGLVSGIIAIIFAAVASNGMKTSGNFEGKGMATTGLILGIIGVVLYVIIFIISLCIGLGLVGLKEARPLL